MGSIRKVAGRLKGVLDNFETQFRGVHLDRDNIESASIVLSARAVQKHLCGFDQMTLFLQCYRCGGRPKGLRAASLDLNENQNTLVTSDEIDFTEPAAKIPLHNTISMRQQVSDRSILPGLAKRALMF
jgi:hypothetical protein